MATTFPLSTYPLSDKTRVSDDQVVSRESMDDGFPRIRVLGSNTFRVISCVFENFTEAQASAFEDYLNTNRSTEFDIVLDSQSPTTTYRGYIWTDPRATVTQGVWWNYTFDFRGQVV